MMRFTPLPTSARRGSGLLRRYYTTVQFGEPRDRFTALRPYDLSVKFGDDAKEKSEFVKTIRRPLGLMTEVF